VGSFVREGEGAGVEGEDVGFFDGDAVEFSVGLVDGDIVGRGVVGEELGLFVGLSVGDDVGFFDGELLGFFVGF